MRTGQDGFIKPRFKKDLRVRLDEDLKEDTIAEAIKYHKVENASQLVRKLLREAIDKSRNDEQPKEVKFRV